MAIYKGKGPRLNKSSHLSNFNVFEFIAALFQTIFEFLKSSKIVVVGILVGIMISFLIIILLDFKNVENLAKFKPNITTKIYDKNGLLISELFKQKREVVSIDKIPKNLVNALIAVEDNEFYDHYGVNVKGIVRAFFVNIFAGRIRQGGSTITQQTAKILLTSRKRNIFRKIKEAFIAIMMEMRYSKKEILALYLNQIFLGHGTYGVESASQLYFNKHVWQLNLAECSLISILPSSPNRLSPIRHPKRAMARHRIALAKMVELGFITVKQAEKAYLDFWPAYLHYISGISPSMNAWSSRVDRAPWFTEYIRRKLLKKFGKEMVYEKGLDVYTTLDLKKQIIARKLLEKKLKRQTAISSKLIFKNDDFVSKRFYDEIKMISALLGLKGFNKKGSREKLKVNNFIRSKIIEEFEGLNYFYGVDDIAKVLDKYKRSFTNDKDFQKVEGCIVSINQRNGYIETMVGGSRFSSMNQLNRVTQSRRQPGSAIKPLLYSAAIESGKFSPATTVLDSPVVFLDNDGGDWLPENYEGEYYGLVRLRKALALSINVVSIRIAEKLGMDYVIKYIAKLLKIDKKNIKRRIPRNLSIALGSLEVSPLELTRAYAIIANGGRDVIPFAIRYIKDRNGQIIDSTERDVKDKLKLETKNGTIQIIKPDTAQTMISMLSSVIHGGTGSYANPGRPSGGKTGTTNNWKDAWFVGFVPRLTTGIWIGYDKLGLSLGIGQAGGGVTAPLWGDYMKSAFKGVGIIQFPGYANLISREVCAHSGLLPNSNCKNLITEIFTSKNLPKKECTLCTEDSDNFNLSKKGPRENISKNQRANIIKGLRKNKKEDNVIDNIGDDLLGE